MDFLFITWSVGSNFHVEFYVKKQVIMSKANGELAGELAVAIPLYCSAPSTKPLAYIIEIGIYKLLMTARFVEENYVFLGDL